MKNRYANVVPYDDSAIVLKDSTYVNASRVPGYDRDGIFCPTAYIATQGPLDSTLDDFYRMILEYRVGVIVMLTSIVEGDQIKCCCYWPRCKNVKKKVAKGVKEPLPLGDPEDVYATFEANPIANETDGVLVLNSVEVQTVEELVSNNVIKRVLRVCSKNDHDNCQTVVQYQYRGWPDHDVPTYSHEIREIINKIEKLRRDDVTPRRPILVHCSAGLGRTGTFIAIHQNMIRMKRAFLDTNLDAKDYYINLYQDVLQMRGCRSGMVQQPAQYFFCYKAIAEEAVELKVIKENPARKVHIYGLDSSVDGDDDEMLDSDEDLSGHFPRTDHGGRRFLQQSTSSFLANSESSGSDLSLSKLGC